MNTSQKAIWWPDFCGNSSLYDAFWSDELTVNTQNPDFSNCFQATALVWGPNAVLWLASIFYIPHLRGMPSIHRWGCISGNNLFKMIIAALLVAISTADLIYTVTMNFDAPENPRPLPVEYVDPAVRAVSLCLAAVLTHWTFRKGIISSGVLFVYWFITLIFNIFFFRSKILQAQQQNEILDMYRFVTFYIYFALVLVQFLMSLFADIGALPPHGVQVTEEGQEEERQPLLAEEEIPRRTPRNPCPKLRASFLSSVFFWWFTSTVFQGYKRPLTMADMWDIREEDSCGYILPVFFKYWAKQLKKAKQVNSSFGYGSISGQKMSVENGEVPSVSSKPEKRKPKVAPSLLKALVQTFGSYFIWAGIFILLHDIFMLLNPQILNLLIAFVQTRDPYVWRGYVYAIVMFLTSVFVVVLFHNALNICYTTGMRIRTAITATLYRKAVRLSSSARKGATVGEIVNLMSVDVQKLQDAPMFFHYIWVSPIIVAIAMYSLWQKLGPSALAGLFFLLLILPLNSIFIGKRIRDFQKQQMKYKDSRIKIMNQVLSGIKVLKLYAWETFFAGKILGIREQELKVIRKAALLNAVNYIVFFCSSFLVGILCFLTYVLSSKNNVLDAATAFVSLSLLNVLAMPLGLLPMAILGLIQCFVSLKRINNFLLQDEIDPNAVSHNPDPDAAITIDGATFSWAKDDRVILKDLVVSVKEGSLVGVVGQVGSGKSSLVSAMLGEMYKLSGSVNVRGSIAYVPQQAWIQNMTLKDNILFNKPLQENQYQSILEACAMNPDLKVLPGGDMTEIGEKGINLSGGQKQRVSLARAVYQDTDIYMLDDPLSAVDAHVGKHIFQYVVGPEGMLKDKTRILVTNAVTYLPKMDKIIVLKDGKISEQGQYADLLAKNGDFAEFIRTYLTEVDEEDAEEELLELKRQISTLSSGGDHTSDGEILSSTEGSLRRRKSRTKSMGVTDKEEKPVKKALIIEESPEEGAIQLSVIKTYIDAASWGWAFMAGLSLLGFIAVQSGNSIWLSIWSNDPVVNGTQDTSTTYLRLGVYGGLGVTQALVVLCLGVSVALGSVAASRGLHTKLLTTILKSPMSFFDTTPLGRILNRFSKDIDVLDANIPGYIQNWMSTMAPVISTLIVISYSTPVFIAVAVPLIIFFVVLQRVYIACARQIKRVDAIKRSPIFANFSETLSGITSIRAYGEQDRFIRHSDFLLDESQRVWFEVFSSNRWIGVWGELLGDLIVLFAGIFAVVQRETLDPGTVGLSISFSLQVSLNIVMSLRSSCELETYIVAVERIKEYSENVTEAPWVIEDRRPPKEWPDQGVVEFDKYSTRYRPGLDLVLDGISCQVSSGEKVGIVGRTGAGKSSMTLALFRIIEAVGGSITIDDWDISTMGLHDIRNKLTIIPQDPVLFSGTLRFNIDPSEKFSEADVWQALEQAHLKGFVSSLQEQLDYECGEDGENLSVGQRQLLCLARALLRKTKILVLDEATAAVDLETDDLIQSTIRTEFKECTVLTIAHRLNTILDYDRVMVMDAGNVKEFDSPTTLLAEKKSAFYSMAQDAGLV